MEKIRVLLKKDSPNSGFGYYNRGDKGYVIDFSQSNAIILLDNGKFARADINSIECIEETEEISGNNGGISPNCELTKFEKWLKEYYLYMIRDGSKLENNVFLDMVKHDAKELLNIAREQIEKEKVAQLKHTEAYNMGLTDGIARALKDMPKWRYFNSGVSYLPDSYGIVYDNDSGENFCCSKPMLCCGNYKISISELVEKLPKEK